MTVSPTYQAMAAAYLPAASGVTISGPRISTVLPGHRSSIFQHMRTDMNAASKCGLVNMEEVRAAARFLRRVRPYSSWRDSVAFPFASMIKLSPHFLGELLILFRKINLQTADPAKASGAYFQAAEQVLTAAVAQQQRHPDAPTIGPHAFLQAALEEGWDGRTAASASASSFQPPNLLVNSPFFQGVNVQAANLTAIPWLVSGLAVRGDISVVSGLGGSAKTTVAIDLLVSVAAQLPDWCGLKIAPRADGQPHQVAIVSAEENINRINLGVAASCQAQKLSPAQINTVQINLWVHDARQSSFRIGAPGARGETLCPEVDDTGCANLKVALAGKSLVVLDTLAAIFWLPNENDNSAATVLMRRLAGILEVSGCSAILLHHTPKMNNEGIAAQRGQATAVRGGGAITNSSRIVWTLTALPASEAGLFALLGLNVGAIRRLDPVKLNDAAPPDPMFFEVVSEWVRIRDGTDVSIRAIKPLIQPQAAAGVIPDSRLNVALRAIDAGTMMGGVNVALSKTATGDRSAVLHIANALSLADPGLLNVHAKAAARQVLSDLMDRICCVTTSKVLVPKFKANGSPNGHETRDGLIAHWNLATWLTVPAPAVPPAPTQAAPAVAPTPVSVALPVPTRTVLPVTAQVAPAAPSAAPASPAVPLPVRPQS
ncbi:AAA family ATPase [Lichenicola sp.]|uniref:AAA family ATPase n=1 Tax=Lichenicola sp. TaxID=2804529 RepID=UPI003B00C898